MNDRSHLIVVRGVLAGMSKDYQTKIDAAADALTATLKGLGDYGPLALALVSAEITAGHERQLVPKTDAQSVDAPPVAQPDLLYIRLLLQHLWARYDAGGESMGRSFDAMLVELAIELLGTEPCPDRYKEPGVLLNEIKTVLSGRRRAQMHMTDPAEPRKDA